MKVVLLGHALKVLQILHLPLTQSINVFFILRNLSGISILLKSLISLSSLIVLSSLILFSSLILSSMLISLSSGSTSGEFLDYHENGFSFQYPAAWTISEFGDQAAGNLSLMNSCSRIDIIWMRDPGFALGSILDQILKTYNQGEIEVVSLSKGEISVQSQNAETAELLYKFKDYKAKKHLAVWISNNSDRLFSISMSSCEEKHGQSEEVFNQILGTFRDGENKEVSLEPRSIQDDVWAIVLGDLLSSYHYKDQRALQSMSVYAEAVHTLMPDNGSYRLFSEEKIRSELSEMALFRAAAVQRLLRNSGYNTSIIQKSGQIRIVVLDPSDKWQAVKWQAVSLNPKEPWRMLGVLTNKSEEYQGLMYKDIGELVNDNLLKVNVSQDLDLYMQKDCDPSGYLQLKHPDQINSSWLYGLQSTLNSHNYSMKYQENIFDCSNTSQICWALLEDKGYDARLMLSYKDHPLGQHMWVVVRYPYEGKSYVAVEATNTNGNSDLVHLGKVTWDDEYYYGIMYNASLQYSWLHPEEGMWLQS